MNNENKKIAIFQKKEIRKTIHNDEWWFVINDIIVALTDSKDPAQYFKRMKARDTELKKLTEQGGVQFVPPLMLEVATAGRKQKIYCWNTEGVFRLIQSIPSKKAEPFKLWLAKVGYERVQEIEDPELATKRTRALYQAKGYSADLELIFSMLGERATTEITQTDNSQGFDKLKQDANDGGKIAGDAKKALEKKTGKKVSTNENYLDAPEKNKRLKNL